MRVERVRESSDARGYSTHSVRDSHSKRIVHDCCVCCGHLGRARKKELPSTSLLLATTVHERSNHKYCAHATHRTNKRTKTSLEKNRMTTNSEMHYLSHHLRQFEPALDPKISLGGSRLNVHSQEQFQPPCQLNLILTFARISFQRATHPSNPEKM